MCFIDYFMAVQFYKCIEGTAPTYLSDRLDYNVSDYNVRNTRNVMNNLLYFPKPRVE